MTNTSLITIAYCSWRSCNPCGQKPRKLQKDKGLSIDVWLDQ